MMNVTILMIQLIMKTRFEVIRLMDFSSFKSMSLDEKIRHLIDDRFLLISSPRIKIAYDALKDTLYPNDEAELTMAWLALFSGDNFGLHQRYQHIRKEHLSIRSLGLYQDLIALSGTFGSIEDRLNQSQQALTSLEGTNDLYLANAYLTHGQILNGMLKLRDAAYYFKKGYDIFLEERLAFASAIALTNSFLISYRLGEMDQTTKEIEQALMIFSQFQSDDKGIVNILKLTLGMCYLEYGRYQMAEKALLQSKEAIDAFDLIHMHGYIEITLIRLYVLTSSYSQLQTLLDKMTLLFTNMHYPMMDVIMYYAKYHLNQLQPSDLETLMFYNETHKVPHPLMDELMMALHHDGKVNYPFDLHLKRIEQSRYAGDRTALIQQLLFLADRYLDEGKKKESLYLVEEIYELYKTFHLTSALKLYHYGCQDLLKKIDSKIELKKVDIQLFTPKEHEILVCIEKGLTNEDIAQKLYISIGTVKWHINHIYSKLDVKHRAEAIKKAKDQGYL